MKEKLREVGLAGLGLGVTIKEKIKIVGRKLVRKGEAQEKRILTDPREKIFAAAHSAGKEALVISKKSLEVLKRELKKLEKEAKKASKAAKRVVKKKISTKLQKKKPSKKRR